MKIDGIREWRNKEGVVQYEVLSIYETPKASGIWAMTGRWYGQDAPVLGEPVRYLQGKYGFLAFPERM